MSPEVACVVLAARILGLARDATRSALGPCIDQDRARTETQLTC